MFSLDLVIVTEILFKEGTILENTHEFVEKLHDKQKKDEQNKKRQGNGNPSEKLPNKQH